MPARIAARPELSGKTINNYVSVLREAMSLAVEDGTLTENPVTVPRAKDQKPEPDPFSREEVELICAAAKQHYPEPIYNLIEWRFFTGVRTSEMAGLHWSSVNLADPAHFVVREALVRGKHKESTKTSVERKVLLNSRALAALERQRKHTQLAGEHVWLDPRYGTPWTEERAFRRSYWTPLLKRLGIRYRAPNESRQTYATMLLMAGRTPAWCAKQMGHSVEIFCRV
jgi:integrase